MCFIYKMRSGESTAIRLYKSLWLLITKKELQQEDIEGEDLCHFHWSLEILFGSFITYRLHAAFFTCFGQIYEKTGLGPGYCYAFPNSRFKNSKFFGHLTGVLFCFCYGKDTGRVISKQLFPEP